VIIVPEENEERKELAEPQSRRSMRSGFDDLFDSFRSEFDDMMNFWWPITPVRRERNRPTTVGYPISDLEDKGDHYRLKVDLPGISKEDVDITVTNDTIEISGEEKEAKEEESTNYLLRERRRASFKRRYGFSDKVLPDKAEAEMKNGILTVKLPKKEPTKIESHKVKIK
jgi:HSP20 family protein